MPSAREDAQKTHNAYFKKRDQSLGFPGFLCGPLSPPHKHMHGRTRTNHTHAHGQIQSAEGQAEE